MSADRPLMTRGNVLTILGGGVLTTIFSPRTSAEAQGASTPSPFASPTVNRTPISPGIVTPVATLARTSVSPAMTPTRIESLPTSPSTVPSISPTRIMSSETPRPNQIIPSSDSRKPDWGFNTLIAAISFTGGLLGGMGGAVLALRDRRMTASLRKDLAAATSAQTAAFTDQARQIIDDLHRAAEVTRTELAAERARIAEEASAASAQRDEVLRLLQVGQAQLTRIAIASARAKGNP